MEENIFDDFLPFYFFYIHFVRLISSYIYVGMSTKRFVFFEFINFVLIYVLYICMFQACCFCQ